MKVVLAIDSFKGCLTSLEANQAAAEGVRSVCPGAEVVQVPVSDGGEGFVAAFHAALGGRLVTTTVCDPLMRPISAQYLLRDKLAVIEIAQASGLTLLTPEERNPLIATSYGTGQLVVDAVRKGAEHIIVGLGGSATSDAGIGMLQAIHDSWQTERTEAGAQCITQNVRFTIATDVRNPLCGEHGAAQVFAPQKFAHTRPEDKGTMQDMVRQLDERARKFAEESAQRMGYDRSEQEGAGAAGGLGYAFLQYLNAESRPGIELLLDTIHFSKLLKDADLVITGEGSADRQTLMGKLPMGILRQAAHVPVWLIAGCVSDSTRLLQAGFSRVECINPWSSDLHSSMLEDGQVAPAGLTLQEAMKKEVAMQNIRATIRRCLHGYSLV